MSVYQLPVSVGLSQCVGLLETVIILYPLISGKMRPGYAPEMRGIRVGSRWISAWTKRCKSCALVPA